MALGIFVGTIHSFLSVTHPIQADILVVEGWVPDNIIIQAKREFLAHPYHLLIATGGPLDVGSFLSEYRSFANRAASSLKNIGIPDSMIITAPAPFEIRDRTYTSALALKDTLVSRRIPYTSINIITQGTHSRRTWLLFTKALGKKYKIGIISVPDNSYDAAHWWKYTTGVKICLVEIFGLLYTWLFFQGW
jgi:uncharacterized SAM-binding protein YcdF (DUF218 family)